MSAIDKKFFHAIEQGDFDAVETSLREGANIFAIREGETVLHLAACRVEERIHILVLNQMKAAQKELYMCINASDSAGHTPLIKAAKYGEGCTTCACYSRTAQSLMSQIIKTKKP